jgi:hypothetical protein
MHLRIGFILEKSALQTTDKLKRSFFWAARDKVSVMGVLQALQHALA